MTDIREDITQIDWDSFVQLSSQGMKHSNLAFDCLDMSNIAPSLVTAVTVGLVERMKKLGFPGIAIAVCDYTREALAFSLVRALENILSIEEFSPLNDRNIPAGSILSLGDSVVEFVSATKDSLNNPNECYIKYKQPSKKKNAQGLTTSLLVDSSIVLHPCPDDVMPTFDSRHSFKDELKKYKELPSIIKALRDRMSSVDAGVAFATSASPYLNIPPTSVVKTSINVDGKSYLLSDCMTLGRFSKGNIKRADTYPLKANPAVVVPSRTQEGFADLFDIFEYLEEGHRLSEIIVEAPTVNCIENQFDSIEDIIEEFHVPIIVFCDESVLRKSSIFEKLGFLTFAWDDAILDKLPAPTHPHDLWLTTREQFVIRPFTKYSPVEDDGRFSCVAEVVYSIAKKQQSISDREQMAIHALTRILGKALRQTEMIDEEASLQQVNTIDWAESVLAGSEGSQSLTPGEMSSVKKACEILKGLSRANIALPKENVAYHDIDHTIGSIGHSVCLVVSGESNEKTASEYWREVLSAQGLPPQNVRAITPKKFLKEDSTATTEEVFLSGWFQREEMERLLLSGLSDRYTLFLYKGAPTVPLETNWLNSAQAYIKTHRAFQRKKTCETLLSLQVEPPSDLYVELEKPSRTQDDSLGGITRQIEAIRDERARANPNNEDVLPGRPVWFTSGTCKWMRVSKDGGDTVLVFTNALDSDGGYSRKTATALQEGDLVLRSEADEDALNEACKAFGSYEETLRVARLWHEPIEAALKSMSWQTVRDRIIRAGCTKNPATITGWIKNRNRISPSDKDDIYLIGQALNSPFSREQVEKMIHAYTIIVGDRISGGKRVTKEIADAFLETAREVGDLEDAVKEFWIRHTDLGSIELLRVEYVGDEAMVPVGRFGWTMV